jgi:hypothetical protein
MITAEKRQHRRDPMTKIENKLYECFVLKHDHCQCEAVEKEGHATFAKELTKLACSSSGSAEMRIACMIAAHVPDESDPRNAAIWNLICNNASCPRQNDISRDSRT